MKIPFNRPYLTGRELHYISVAHANSQLSGDGPFTDMCSTWLQQRTGCSRALLTHSCTAALEMAALLLDIRPGQEVIMPSYTFVSTANAFVARAGVPVFVDIRPDTLNLDEAAIEAAITDRTRAIVPVHYAGVACNMDSILAIAARHGLLVIEDAAQGIMSTYRGRPLGSMGHLAALSFHETKNLVSGEGGALLINDAKFSERAEIVREKGTNRSKFFRGQVDKYTWVDVGSSYLPGEIIAAFLWGQMEYADEILRRRRALWHTYHEAFEGVEKRGLVRRPFLPPECGHNAHMYYLIFATNDKRNTFIAKLRERDIDCVFHYVPLHSSPAGLRYGRASGSLAVTERVSDTLVRLPLWIGLEEQINRVIEEALRAIRESA